MKKSLKALAIMLAAMTMTTGVMAAEESRTSFTGVATNVLADLNLVLPSVYENTLEINGTKIELASTPLVSLEGRVYLPMRKFANLLGLSNDYITWDSEKSEAAIEFSGMKFKYNVESGQVYLNDNLYESDEEVFTVHSGTVYIKARLLCAFLGSNINWNSESFSLGISKVGIVIPKDMIYVEPIPVIVETTATAAIPLKGRRYTANELDLLARIVEAEAKDQAYEGKVAVANVILNRVDSSQFPNTIYDVVYQKSSSGSAQFSPVRTGSINNKASASSIQAAKEALEGKVVVKGALFFNATWVKGSWASRNRKFCMTLDTHNFYY